MRAVLLAAAALAAGCSTHTDRIRHVSEAAYAGDYVAALESIDGVLGVESDGDLPEKWGADSALLLLDRAMLLQSLGRYADAARDVSAAEEKIELIDLTKDPVGTLAGYLYSDSDKPYRALPSERLAVNAFNLLNYIALGDLEGAAVEARRFQAVRDYLDTESIDDGGVSTLGAYFAGFTFEKRGEGDRALRYYEDALAAGPLESLVTPAAALLPHNPFRGPNLEALMEESEPAKTGKDDAELLVVVNVGRAPQKVPERIPIGAAIGIAGAYATEDEKWLTRGITKVVVYPELVSVPSTLGPAVVQVDGIDVPVETLIDLEAGVRAEYDEMKPKIVAAAITRLASRAAVAEGARAAGQQESDALGEVVAALIEGALVSLDRPDTRSWTMMPGRVLVARIPVTPGTHTVDVGFAGTEGAGGSTEIEVGPRQYVAVVVTEPR